MHQLHKYYMAQATETEDFGFEVIIRSPHIFHYPEEEKFDVEWECLFQLYQKHSRFTNVDDVDYVSTLHI